MPEKDELDKVMQLIIKMRDDNKGDAWHKQQTMQTIMPETLAEIYELLEAIDLESVEQIKDELGDVLFHVLYYVQLATEKEWFTLHELLGKIAEKLIRRHPQVFNRQIKAQNTALFSAWENIKQTEQSRPKNVGEVNLARVSKVRPALLRAVEIQQQARFTGFDWNSIAPIISKIQEELAEAEEAIKTGESSQVIEELGDLLFACTNLIRKCQVNPEYALHQANEKFIKRFSKMQANLSKEQRESKILDLKLWDKLWEEVKIQERMDKN